MLNKSLQAFLEELLSQKLNSKIDILKTDRTYGGSINETLGLTTNQGKFFLKLNDKNTYPEMFEKEKLGLELLKNKSSLHIPEVIAVGEYGSRSFLIMDFVISSAPKQSFWEEFGRGLANLHRNTSTRFGLEYNNYIGSLQQYNSTKNSWVEFFIEQRLNIQEKWARESGLLDKETSLMLQKLYVKLDQIFPEEPVALLHGDLWSGNFLVNEQGSASIIDPAVYYGNREMDIAMSLLFGGFQKQFYEAYHEAFPLADEWEQRIEVCNLYPLLVHVNLFGSSYAGRVNSILKRLT